MNRSPSSLAFAAIALTLPGATAHADVGGTFDLGIGGGAIYRRHEDGASKTVGASAAPYMSIGVKLTPRLGMVARVSLLSNDANGTFLQFGPNAQYWITNRLFVSGGVGIAAYYFPKPVMIGGDNVKGYGGLGFSARVGYALAGEHHRWTLAVESTPAFFPHDTSVGVALVGAYQYW